MATTSDNYQKLPVMDAVEISSYGSPPPPYPNVQTVQPGVTKLAFNGEVRQQQPRMNRIYFAIFAMVCCFWPLGLVALLKAIKGMQSFYNGDLGSAEAQNKSSKKWSIASVVVGVLIIIAIHVFIALARTLPDIIISALNKNGTEKYDHNYHGKMGHHRPY